MNLIGVYNKTQILKITNNTKVF